MYPNDSWQRQPMGPAALVPDHHHPQLYPPPTPPRLEPPDRRSNHLWILGGPALAVVVVVVAAIVIVGLTGQPGKPDISQITEAMLVDRSSFPDHDGASWQRGVLSPARLSKGASTPVECSAVLAGLPSATQAGNASLSARNDVIAVVTIELPQQKPDVKGVAHDCARFQPFPAKMQPWTTHSVNLAGLPAWAIALELDSDRGDVGLIAMGVYRGVFIHAEVLAGMATSRAVSKLFNAEVAKLQAA